MGFICYKTNGCTSCNHLRFDGAEKACFVKQDFKGLDIKIAQIWEKNHNKSDIMSDTEIKKKTLFSYGFYKDKVEDYVNIRGLKTTEDDKIIVTIYNISEIFDNLKR